MRSAVIVLLGVSACEPELFTEGGALAEAAWVAPENRWPVGSPPDTLSPEGMGVGQVVLDIRGPDQHGDEVSLWQFHDRWIVLDIATMWCAPCRDLAVGTEAIWQTYKDRGLVYVTVLLEDQEGQPPDVADLQAWTSLAALDEEHGYDTITAPIMADPEGASGSIAAIDRGQYPAVLLVDRDLRVAQRIEPVTESRVVQVIEGLGL